MNKTIEFDNSYERLPALFYKKINLHGVKAPRLIYFNEELARDLGLESFNLQETGLDMFSGTKFPPGASSIAQAYMGHQFGYLTMLGDGRTNLIGEVINPLGKRYDIQLKGSGRTPFSRGGDGKAALGPMLKELLFSEALHKLGIPSSRSLAVVVTGEPVYRNQVETGAILTRVMESHLRVGTFVYAAVYGTKTDIKSLADYAINRHYPKLKTVDQVYMAFYHSVIKAQAETVAQWMAYGFIHGVMNTDNMAISGETFDFGPCALLDDLNSDAVFSSIDRQGRYAYGNQPSIAIWNLHRFGEALLPLLQEYNVKEEEIFEEATDIFKNAYNETYYGLMCHRLGIKSVLEESKQLVDEFTGMMQKTTFDYNQTFIDITTGELEREEYRQSAFQLWLEKWVKQVNKERDLESSRSIMKEVNPSVVLRNYWVQKSIEEAEQGNLELYEKFYNALKNPFSYNESDKDFGPVQSEKPYVTFCGT